MKYKLKQILSRVLSRFGLILFGMIIGLISLEIAFRLLYPAPSPKLINQALQLHETYGFAFTPNAEGWNTSLRGEYNTYIRINNKGLRGKEYSYTKDVSTFRILVLGDSFTAALQVAEKGIFTSLLENQLNQHYSDTNFEVINAGIVGYGTANQLSFFTHEGYKYDPDLILLAFFTGNDILDNISPPHYKLENGKLIPIQAVYNPDIGTPPWAKEGTFFRKLRNYLYTHSRLYSVLIELLAYSLIQQSPDLINLLNSIGLAEITRPVGNVGNIYSFLQPPEEAWEMTEALILKFHKEVQAQGSQLIIIILPDETEVNTTKWEKLFQKYPDLFNRESVNEKPTKKLAQFLEKNGIPYLQLQPAFQAYQQKNKEAVFYQIDGHWKPRGHYIVSQEIYNYLIQNAEWLENFPQDQ